MLLKGGLCIFFVLLSLNSFAIIDTKVSDLSQNRTLQTIIGPIPIDCPSFKNQVGTDPNCDRNVQLVEKQDLDIERQRVDQTFLTLSEQLPQEIFTNPVYLKQLRKIIREEFIKLNNENKGQ